MSETSSVMEHMVEVASAYEDSPAITSTEEDTSTTKEDLLKTQKKT